MNNQKILFGGFALALFLVSCGKSTTDSPIADDGTVHLYGAKVATTSENLPTCDSTQLGQLFFVLAEESFQFCSSTGYESIDLHGIVGEDGADGVDGKNGTNGTNGKDGTDGVDGVDGEDGATGAAGEAGTSCLANQRNDSLFIDCSGVLDTIVNGADGVTGPAGASCTISDDGMGTLTQTCGVTSKSWPKAVCGIQAYDPSTHFCDIRDNKTYKYVTIGTQTWMAENLNYGAMVTSAVGQVNDAVVEKYCYNDGVDYCTTSGGLYSWAESMDFLNTCNTASCASQISTDHHQGICPTGWHIPKTAEWDNLATYLGGGSIAGSKMKLNNTGFTDWDVIANNDGNSSCFSAFPAGLRFSNVDFFYRGSNVYFWEATEYDASDAHSRILNYSSDLHAYNYSKFYGFSVRCISDNQLVPFLPPS